MDFEHGNGEEEPVGREKTRPLRDYRAREYSAYITERSLFPPVVCVGRTPDRSVGYPLAILN